MTYLHHHHHHHLNIFIGYDERQDLAYRVCKESLEQTTSKPLTIYPLKHRTLRDIGLLTREWKIQRDGYTIDLGDSRPFSTNFAFSRFLVPKYAKYLGVSIYSTSVFVDSDFVFLRDIYSLFDEINVTKKPIWCVKHNYNTPNLIKMDNQSQMNYNKKLWSSFMVFNTQHPHCSPTVEQVNEQSGSWLHGFNWLSCDEDIGSLHEGWNTIPDHSEERVPTHDIRAIHFTEGTPMMKPGCKYAEVFNYYLRSVLAKSLINIETLN